MVVWWPVWRLWLWLWGKQPGGKYLRCAGSKIIWLLLNSGHARWWHKRCFTSAVLCWSLQVRSDGETVKCNSGEAFIKICHKTFPRGKFWKKLHLKKINSQTLILYFSWSLQQYVSMFLRIIAYLWLVDVESHEWILSSDWLKPSHVGFPSVSAHFIPFRI